MNPLVPVFVMLAVMSMIFFSLAMPRQHFSGDAFRKPSIREFFFRIGARISAMYLCIMAVAVAIVALLGDSPFVGWAVSLYGILVCWLITSYFLGKR